MSIKERVRALLESLRAGRVCVEVDDVAGNEPTTISASVEMYDGETWSVLEQVPCDEAAVKLVADVVRRELVEARSRFARERAIAARSKRDVETMEAALSREELLASTNETGAGE